MNAVYHRSYEIREPIEVRISQDDVVVLSFPGPDRSIQLDQLRCGKAVSRRYRNRRIGEFLEELELPDGRISPDKAISMTCSFANLESGRLETCVCSVFDLLKKARWSSLVRKVTSCQHEVGKH